MELREEGKAELVPSQLIFWMLPVDSYDCQLAYGNKRIIINF